MPARDAIWRAQEILGIVLDVDERKSFLEVVYLSAIYLLMLPAARGAAIG